MNVVESNGLRQSVGDSCSEVMQARYRYVLRYLPYRHACSSTHPHGRCRRCGQHGDGGWRHSPLAHDRRRLRRDDRTGQRAHRMNTSDRCTLRQADACRTCDVVRVLWSDSLRDRERARSRNRSLAIRCRRLRRLERTNGRCQEA